MNFQADHDLPVTAGALEELEGLLQAWQLSIAPLSVARLFRNDNKRICDKEEAHEIQNDDCLRAS
jgi:hypothetical protein